MSAVRQLREVLELRFPDAMPLARGLAPAVATGVRELDAALPNGGLPRGCLTVWRGGAAASGLLRSACVETVARGERAAWVDGAGVTVGDFWPPGVMMVRPQRHTSLNTLDTSRRRDTSMSMRALAAAEELLRSGGFALVVVTGVPGGMEAELVRLSRVAREGGGAVVTVEQPVPDGRPAGSVAAARLRVETWYRPEAHAWRTGVFGEPVELATMGVGARVTGTGWLRHVNLELPVLDHAYRLSLDPGLVDRRGVKPVQPERRPAEAEPVRPLPSVVEIDVERVAEQELGPVEHAVEHPVEHVVEHVARLIPGSVQPAVAPGLAGAGAAGGGDAGGGAAAADRGARPGLGRRAWPGRAPLRRAAARVPVRSGLA